MYAIQGYWFSSASWPANIRAADERPQSADERVNELAPTCNDFYSRQGFEQTSHRRIGCHRQGNRSEKPPLGLNWTPFWPRKQLLTPQRKGLQRRKQPVDIYCKLRDDTRSCQLISPSSGKADIASLLAAQWTAMCLWIFISLSRVQQL